MKVHTLTESTVTYLSESREELEKAFPDKCVFNDLDGTFTVTIDLTEVNNYKVNTKLLLG